MEGVGVVGGTLLLAVVVLGIILAILAILMPLFVFRIRNEIIQLNSQFADAVRILNMQSEQLNGVTEILKTQAKILLKQMKS
jgi:hypothetical protein